jgi:hypothetical protein
MIAGILQLGPRGIDLGRVRLLAQLRQNISAIARFGRQAWARLNLGDDASTQAGTLSGYASECLVWVTNGPTEMGW